MNTSHNVSSTDDLFMNEIKNLIRSKLEYDKEVYDKNTYTRDYRSIKLEKFHNKYSDIHVGYTGTVINDVPDNGADYILYGAEWEDLPEEIFALISQLREFQSVCLHLFYPETIKDICYRQNLYFLNTITAPQFTPKILESVFLIIPVCYIMRFGSTKANNKMQVMFYFRSYTCNHRTYMNERQGKCFFNDNLSIKELKKSSNRIKSVIDYITNLQRTLFQSGDKDDFFRNLVDFQSCFKQITIHGT